MATDTEVIGFIHDLYADEPGRWIKDVEARTASGYSRDPKSVDVAQFCLIGGLKRYSCHTAQQRRLEKLIMRFAPDSYSSTEAFNDAKKTDLPAVLHVLESVLLHLKHT